MKLFTFEIKGRRRVGVLAAGGARLVDVSDTAPDMLSLIRGGGAALQAVRSAATSPAGTTYALAEVKLLAPIPRPGKILCSGINYKGHKEENPDAKMPTEPFFFAKMPSAVIGPGEPIIHPRRTSQLDYEVEFAVVIGRTMTDTPESDVAGCIFGYTLLHDVSARDVQFKDNQITLGKNFDSFCPLGPCIVTADELADPSDVQLRTRLNGKVLQDGSTSGWVFSLGRLLSFLSQTMTLEPGDVVSTGTPAGVGVFRKPQVFMKPGDIVQIEAEGIGVLENPVVAAAPLRS